MSDRSDNFLLIIFLLYALQKLNVHYPLVVCCNQAIISIQRLLLCFSPRQYKIQLQVVVYFYEAKTSVAYVAS